jgi:PH domain/RhoGEF domain
LARKQAILSAEQVHTVFSNLELLVDTSETFLKKLSKVLASGNIAQELEASKHSLMAVDASDSSDSTSKNSGENTFDSSSSSSSSSSHHSGTGGNTNDMDSEMESSSSSSSSGSDSLCVGQLFLQMQVMFGRYQFYSSNLSRSFDTLTELVGKNTRFAELIRSFSTVRGRTTPADAQTDEALCQSMFQYLELPFRRVQQYARFLSAMAAVTPPDHVDAANLQRAEALADAAVERINESMSDCLHTVHDELAKVSFELGLEDDFAASERILVRYGCLHDVDGNGVHLYLLSDLLLLARQRDDADAGADSPGATMRVIFRQPLWTVAVVRCSAAAAVESASPFDDERSLRVAGLAPPAPPASPRGSLSSQSPSQLRNIVLRAADDSECSAWLAEIAAVTNAYLALRPVQASKRASILPPSLHAKLSHASSSAASIAAARSAGVSGGLISRLASSAGGDRISINLHRLAAVKPGAGALSPFWRDVNRGVFGNLVNERRALIERGVSFGGTAADRLRRQSKRMQAPVAPRDEAALRAEFDTEQRKQNVVDALSPLFQAFLGVDPSDPDALLEFIRHSDGEPAAAAAMSDDDGGGDDSNDRTFFAQLLFGAEAGSVRRVQAPPASVDSVASDDTCDPDVGVGASPSASADSLRRQQPADAEASSSGAAASSGGGSDGDSSSWTKSSDGDGSPRARAQTTRYGRQTSTFFGASRPNLPRRVELNDVTLKAGELTKQGKMKKNWKRRYFVLTPTCLYYFKASTDIRPVGAIPLDGTTTVCIDQQILNKDYCWQIVTCERVFYVHADNKRDMDDWMSAIRTPIDHMKSGAPALRAAPLPSSPNKQGYLTKQGAVVKNWKRRWFILKNHVLYYYKDKSAASKKDAKSSGSIALDQFCHVSVATDSAKSFCLEIATRDRKYFAYADDRAAMHDWIDSINQSIVSSSN